MASGAPVRVTRYAPVLLDWPVDCSLRIAVLSDFHACEPWTDAGRIRSICDQANALRPDIILLLGDYAPGPRLSRRLAPTVWASELARLTAPLGVHAVLGNHDYDGLVRADLADGPPPAHRALEAAGIDVYENQARWIARRNGDFWLGGVGSQMAFWRHHTHGTAGIGVDDLETTLRQIGKEGPVILMAHEPDLFARLPPRVSLTLSGHTHGGQVKLWGHTPVVPSAFGSRYVHGHVVEEGRHLIVSAGLGYSGWPVRFGVPPEIVLVTLGEQPR
jgi:uncharacterized protein